MTRRVRQKSSCSSQVSNLASADIIRQMYDVAWSNLFGVSGVETRGSALYNTYRILIYIYKLSHTITQSSLPALLHHYPVDNPQLGYWFCPKIHPQSRITRAGDFRIWFDSAQLKSKYFVVLLLSVTIWSDGGYSSVCMKYWFRISTKLWLFWKRNVIIFIRPLRSELRW